MTHFLQLILSDLTVVAWARCWPLHIWALMGLIAWGLFSVEWFVLWELGGACAVFQRIEVAR